MVAARGSQKLQAAEKSVVRLPLSGVHVALGDVCL